MPAQLIPSVSDALFHSLGRLGFQRFIPRAQLLPWVQCYWVAQQHQLPGSILNETVYPDGGTTLIFNFAQSDCPDITFLATQTTGKICFQGPVNHLGIRFNPGGAFQLMGLAMPEIIGGNISADDLAWQPLLELREQLAELTQLSQRLVLIDTWLLDLAKNTDARAGLIQRLLPQLYLPQETAKQITIDQLSANLPISRRQLERKFQLEVGCSPNQLQQLHRVKLARTLISERPDQSLTDVGQAAGFYDQAHFIRHFQKITDQTPGQYRQRKMSQTYNSTNG